jgi:hypothetical protein
MADAPTDRVQLRSSDEGKADRDYIKDHLGLAQGQDAYRLGVALAKNLPGAPEDARRSTVYGADDVDVDGALRAAVLALRDDHGNMPYALIERLAEAGMRDLAVHLNEGLPIRTYLAALVPPKPED